MPRQTIFLRGYMYDAEISLYYLNAIYYNSKLAYYINIDIYIGVIGELFILQYVCIL